MSCCGPKKECEPTIEPKDVQKEVKEYYGQVLQKSEDLKTNACTTGASMPLVIRKILGSLHDEVVSKYYGCGLTIPMDYSNLKGLRVLDLGSGSGRDCYLLSKLVGPDGFVVGVDMTDEQLAVANRHVDYHTKQFGYEKPNVEFLKGYIEKLDELGLKEGSFDVIVSNCVINLSTDKQKVLNDVFKLLKEGGEFYFSDVYADRRVPKKLAENAVVWGECLGGALYWNDFINISKRAGFTDPRLVEHSEITIQNKDIERQAGKIRFHSATFRLFRSKDLEPACEDYGEAAVYKGGIESCPHSFILDKEHEFEVGKVMQVCGNTRIMLKNTRLSPYFEIFGDASTHYGIFEGCGTGCPFNTPKSESEASSVGGGCC
eukprot:CAMPEP_0201531716 /NCGR_PEP_ID=MMETSP0161_2-20130828/48416_1 /ASSEMBLY_ACC=CAM_ASM_000251 /TAXON_ID=180227 /ORGANISM="Neoparamoeba aestuarina, Strain SoJaBio B1-5/56/2" /LENGTH=373 /DNA_ID=CAMNT_0047934771 /DNA_START=93 /DNA_END=1214 /DNA_ORIENTATION=-